MPASSTTQATNESRAPATDDPTVQAVIEIGGGEALGLAVDSEAVWAVSFERGTLTRIDPTTSAATSTFEIAPGVASVSNVADSLWIVSYGSPDGTSLYRIDPPAETVVATVRAGELCCDLSSGDGFVWAIDPDGRVVQVDPATNAVIDTFPVTIDVAAHTNAVFAGGALWVSSDTTQLARLDPASGAIDEFDVGGGVPFVVW